MHSTLLHASFDEASIVRPTPPLLTAATVKQPRAAAVHPCWPNWYKVLGPRGRIDTSTKVYLYCAALAVATQQISPISACSRYFSPLSHDSRAPKGAEIKFSKNLALRVCSAASLLALLHRPVCTLYRPSVHAAPAVPASAVQNHNQCLAAKPATLETRFTLQASQSQPPATRQADLANLCQKTGEPGPPDWTGPLVPPCFRALFLAARHRSACLLKSKTPARDRDRETCLCSAQ